MKPFFLIFTMCLFAALPVVYALSTDAPAKYWEWTDHIYYETDSQGNAHVDTSIVDDPEQGGIWVVNSWTGTSCNCSVTFKDGDGYVVCFGRPISMIAPGEHWHFYPYPPGATQVRAESLALDTGDWSSDRDTATGSW
uniref:Uncharacterized protein n=1 Tax=viral metagenome TaxID=1070528 RepID=A0A6M3LA59_9ZZZZ